MAKISSPSRTTATSMSSTVDREGLPSAASSARRAGALEAHQKCLAARSWPARPRRWRPAAPRSRDADLADDVVEEAVHDQPTRLVLRDAARLQVEQLLVVEPAGGRRVAGTLDLAGLDLQVGHRVGLAAVGEHEVAVLLVGLDALGDLADQHVADPHGVRALALQRALVDDVAAGVRRGVVDEQPVLDVLAGVGEVEAEQLGRAARSVVRRRWRPSAPGRRRRRSRRACSDASRPTRACWCASGARRRRPSPAPTPR